MALEGSLDTFGLADVLSLLAMTSKSGVLRLRREDIAGAVTGSVRLREGMVVAASSDDAQQALARQLIVSGLISDDAFAAALGSGATAEDLPAALVTAAALSPETVEPLSHEQVLGAVLDLLRWPGGVFTFDVTDSAPTAADAALTVERAIAEATGRLSDWPALTARLPAPGTPLAVAVTVDSQAVLTPAEWGVLGLFDGHRSIADALSLSISGEWETVSLLAGLLERGLLVPAHSANSAAHRAAMLARIGLYGTAAAVPAGLPEPPAAFVGVVPALASVPAQPSHGDRVPLLEPDLPDFADFSGLAPETDSLASLADAAALLAPADEVVPEVPEVPEPAPAAVAPAPGDGVDEALLQHLIAGVRAL